MNTAVTVVVLFKSSTPLGIPSTSKSFSKLTNMKSQSLNLLFSQPSALSTINKLQITSRLFGLPHSAIVSSMFYKHLNQKPILSVLHVHVNTKQALT